MPTYTVKSPIKHAGNRIEAGGTVEMDETAAAPLIAIGALGGQDIEQEVDAPEASASSGSKPARGGNKAKG